MLPWDERLHGVGAHVIIELVRIHEGLVRFPAVAEIVESGPPDVELQGGVVDCGRRGVQGSTQRSTTVNGMVRMGSKMNG